MNNNQFKIYSKPTIAPTRAIAFRNGFPSGGVFVGEDTEWQYLKK